LTINPLFPFIPAFISFFLYGWITSGIFSFGRRGGRGCLFTLFFWYAFLVFAIFVWLFVSVQSTTNQLSFIAGAFIPYIGRIWESETVQRPIAIASDVAYFFKRISQKIAEMLEVWQAKKTHHQNAEESSQQAEPNQHKAHTGYDDAMKQEQARREAEARERREQAERERQRQQENTDTRSPEEVLGLLPQWTQDDLRNAYKREAGRTHPDKWIGKPEPIRQAMEEEYKRIQEAYRRLKNE
jgi:hypothetical protein